MRGHWRVAVIRIATIIVTLLPIFSPLAGADQLTNLVADQCQEILTPQHRASFSGLESIKSALSKNAQDYLVTLKLQPFAFRYGYKYLLGNIVAARLIHKRMVFRNVSIRKLLSLLEPMAPYNFVIMNRELRLASVNVSALAQLFVKHMMLSDYQAVQFAGVMWKDDNDVLHLSNDSGTYLPTAEQLTAAAAFLSEQLQVRVETHPILPGNVKLSHPL